MYLIIGLGNPGKDYKNTRHNIGFDVIETLAEEERIGVLEKKHKAVIGKGVVAGQKVLLAMPQTYMNLSGESVRELVDYYKVDETCEVIVISDDISLAPGQIRIRKKGSAGGHNGIKSLIQSLGTVNGIERFDANTASHVHFFCTGCDAVLDLPQIEVPSSFGSEAQNLSGCQVKSCQLTMTGLCSNCRANN